MAVLTLDQDIKSTGINQKDLVDLLTNLVTVVNELVDDHATNIACIAANKTAINAIIAAATTDSATNIAAVTVVSASPAATLTNSTNLTLNGG